MIHLNELGTNDGGNLSKHAAGLVENVKSQYIDVDFRIISVSATEQLDNGDQFSIC